MEMVEAIHDKKSRQSRLVIYANLERVQKLNPNTVAVVRDAQLWKDSKT